MTEQVEFYDQLVLHIHPQYLDSQIGQHVKKQLESRLEHKWSEAHGFVTDVEMLPLTNAGRMNAKTGYTEITVHYRAKSCKAVIGKNIQAEVTLVTKLGIHFSAGPLKMFLHEKMLPPSYVSLEDAFRCTYTDFVLKKGVVTTVRIVGTSWTDGEYMIIVTL